MSQFAYPMAQAIMAAALFGASAPIAKALLGRIEPIPLAGLLYLGSGIGLVLVRTLGFHRLAGEARLGRSDLPWLAGSVLAGGVAAPIVLMLSLRSTQAATASLLLNFESVATTLIAALIFKEAIGTRIWCAIGAITAASILLSWDSGGQWGISLGALGILGACILWGMDNNFTRNISAKDPTAIAAIKGLGAGAFSLALALAVRNPFPAPVEAAKAMLLGSLSYGASIVLFIHAMRSLGAARTSALFGTAPFMGALLSFAIFQEAPSRLFMLSTPLMIAGAAFLVGEKHRHLHKHVWMWHEHRHRHDDSHHNHHHAEEEFLPPRFHSHAHAHEAVEHSHPHTPDIHHRHAH